MESTVAQQSFIPQDAGQLSAVRASRQSVGLNELMSVISAIILLASLALAGGVFLYQQFLNAQLAFKTASLQRAREEFDPALVARITRLDDRLNVAGEILHTHLAPSVFFDALSQVTLATVSFQALNLKTDNANNIGIKMQGVARSINSIALQADLFGKNNIIRNPIFSTIDQQPDGVHFNLTAAVEPSAISYAQFSTGAALPVPPGQPSNAASSSAPALPAGIPSANDTPSSSPAQ